MVQPSISVVIPHADQPQTLMNAVLSVLRQSLKPSEIIVVENSLLGISDVLCNELISLGVRIVYCEPNKSASYARNVGVKASHSEFVAFLDADDTWKNDKLSVVFNNLAVSKVDCVTSDFLFLKNSSLTKMPMNFDSQNIYLNFHTGFGSTGVIRKEVFDSLGGFDEELKRFEDWDFIIRLKEKNFSYLHLNTPLVVVNRIPSQNWDWAHFSIVQFKSKPRKVNKKERRMLKSGIALELAVISFRKRHIFALVVFIIQMIFYSPGQLKLLLKMSGVTKDLFTHYTD
jgi:glycosyltransferase involved in cell wall biosynthesis